MKKPQTRTIFYTLTLGVCLVYSTGLGRAKENIVFQSMVPKLDPLPTRKILRGSVAETTLVAPPPTNSYGYAEQGSGYPTTVTYVTPNSVAWVAGLQAGDRLVNGRVKPDKAILIVLRGGKKYGCVMDADGASTLAANLGNAAGKRLSANAAKSDAQTLAGYGMAMVVDSSASMGTKDCPGDISRWQWCKDHISDLYFQDRCVLAKNISIVTFDTNFRSRQNCTPGELQTIFANESPTGETNMAPALDEAFLLVRRRLDAGSPAIVTVISDGRPSDADNVKKTIIRETNALPKPKLLSIVFIEVGTPEHYLQELDADLLKQGAKADIVTVIPFATISSQGLAKTLVAAVPKLDERASPVALSAGATVSAANKAKEAVSTHIYTYSPPTSPPTSVKTPPPKAVSARPAIVPAPVIKAHPTGTPAAGAPAVAKPLEVDEKAAVLRSSANRTYK